VRRALLSGIERAERRECDDIDPVRLRLLIIGQLNWVSEWPRSAIGSRDDVQREATALIMGGVVPSAV
jgi:hypothetical protein